MTGILTFYWADNYGALLQAYALKTYLERQGETVEIIPYAPLKFRGGYQLIPVNAVCKEGRWKFYRDFRSFCLKLSFGRQFFKRRTAMRRFRKRYLTDKAPVEEIKRLRLRQYDFILVGSDQVWNSEITYGLDDAYMGNIEKERSCRLIAYGASFGREKPPESEWQQFKRAFAENFYAVSLREKKGADFAKRLSGRSVADVLDPVFLLGKEEWEKFGRTPGEKEYILLYAVEYQESMFQLARSLSEAYRKPVISLSCPFKRKQEKENLLRMEAGPKEFAGYFRSAFCVVTNSFHGLAFCILFEKQFLVFGNSVYHVRQENLLEKLMLKQRLIRPDTAADLSCMEEAIDWRTVRKHLREEQKHSESFIKEGMKRV